MDKNKLKELECKYVIEKMKRIIPRFDMKHLYLEHLLVIRSTIQEHPEPLHIYLLSRPLSYVWGIFYVIEVQPTFDLMYDYEQYRAIYHILKHIPSDYQKFPRILPHNVEIFTGEEYFDKQIYKKTLDIKGDYDG